ncbi:MAG: efflux transporter outer membrane subunit [Lautropia sp.]|nr:efflux transporter outer membrane subunit [Lautropia sp.]
MSSKPSLRLTTLAALMFLAGCGSLAPVHQTPEAPVAGRFADADAGDTGTAMPAAADLPWQQFFASPRLKQLIQIALDNNRDLRIATQNIEKARAAYRIQRADRLPAINLVGSGERAPSMLTGEQASTYSVGLGITSFELDFFGRVKNLADATLATYLGTEEARRTAQISLIANVANGYLTLLSLDEQLELTRQTLKTREESHDLTELQYKNGAASAMDAKQAESLVQSARSTLATLTTQRAVAKNALTVLLGQEIPPLPEGMEDSTEIVAITDLPAGLPSETLIRRPDIRQAEYDLRSANANIGAARAAFFPRITLTGTAGVGSTQLNDLFDQGKFAWTLSPQLVLPIFDYGRNKANLGVAKADREIAIASYEKAIQTAFQEVSDALATRKGLVDQLDAQQKLVSAENDRLDLANMRYKNGVSSYFDVLDAQRSAFSAQQSLIEARTRQRQNLVDLYKVLGGGWQ